VGTAQARAGRVDGGTGAGEAGHVGATVGRTDGTGTGVALPGPPVLGTGAGTWPAAVGMAVGVAAAGAGVAGFAGPVLAGPVFVGAADGTAEAVPSAACPLALSGAADDTCWPPAEVAAPEQPVRARQATAPTAAIPSPAFLSPAFLILVFRSDFS